MLIQKKKIRLLGISNLKRKVRNLQMCIILIAPTNGAKLRIINKIALMYNSSEMKTEKKVKLLFVQSSQLSVETMITSLLAHKSFPKIL